MGNKLKLILVIAAVALAMFLVYAFFLKSAPAREGLVTTAAPVDRNTASTLRLLDQMKSLGLDRSIFSNPLYQRLQDFGVEILPQPYGRPNPFASIGSDAQFSPKPSAPQPSATTTKTNEPARATGR